MRKHRLAERLLTDVIGLDWSYVHEEACRWEHVMSDRVEKRLVELLDHPRYSPYGNPIPGMAELGEERVAEQFLDGVVSLVVFARAIQDRDQDRDQGQNPGPVPAVVGRLGEPVQTDTELLGRLAQAGVLPGAPITVDVSGALVTVGVPGSGMVLDLSEDVARHVFVRAPGTTRRD
jgi:DtxR family Mn-dependent transcriptional regulator